MRFAIPIFLAFVGPLAAQPPDFGTPVDPKSFDDIATVETSIDPKAAKPGEVVTLKFTIFLKAFCHTYPILPKQASNNKIITPKGPLIDVG